MINKIKFSCFWCIVYSFVFTLIGVSPTFAQSKDSQAELQTLLAQANQLHHQRIAALIDQRNHLQSLKEQYQQGFVKFDQQALQAWGLSAVSVSGLLLLEANKSSLGRATYFFASASIVVANALAAAYRIQIGQAFDEQELIKAHGDIKRWIDRSNQELDTLKHPDYPQVSDQIDKVLLSVNKMESQLFDLQTQAHVEHLSDSLRSYRHTSMVQSALHSLIAIRVAAQVFYQRAKLKPRNQMSGYLFGAQVFTLVPSLISNDFQAQVLSLIDQSIYEIDQVLLPDRR